MVTRGSPPRGDRVAAHLVTGVLASVVALSLSPCFLSLRATRRQEACRRNLEAIAGQIRVYRADYDGELPGHRNIIRDVHAPSNLQHALEGVLTSLEPGPYPPPAWQCPAGGTYMYAGFGPYATDFLALHDPEEIVVAWDLRPCHPGDTVHVAFLSGRVEAFPADRVFTVDARRKWGGKTGLVLAPGQIVWLYAAGQWTTNANCGPDSLTAPCGYSRNPASSCLSSTMPNGSLLGRVGESRPYGIGLSRPFTASSSGKLTLSINDSGFGDNGGVVWVFVDDSPSQ